jgi:hypothetical protein
MKQNAQCMKKFCLAEFQVELLINATYGKMRLVTHISSEITYVGMKQYVTYETRCRRYEMTCVGMKPYMCWYETTPVYNDMCRYELVPLRYEMTWVSMN